MEETIETRAPAEKVWRAWEMAHEKLYLNNLKKQPKTDSSGCLGDPKPNAAAHRGIRYEVVDIVRGESFSLLWKTLFVRLIVSHSVIPKKRGSEIRCSFEMRGLFAAPLRWLLKNKIRKNIRQVLKTMIQRLESA